MNLKYLKLLPVAALLLFGIFTIRAQTPGGATNTTFVAWLTSDNYNSVTWTNLITDANTVGDFTPTATAPVKGNTGGFNFYPVVTFTKTSAAAVGNPLRSQNLLSVATTDNVSAIVVLQRNNPQYTSYLMTFSQTDNNYALNWRTANNNVFTVTWPTTGRNVGNVAGNGILTVDITNSIGTGSGIDIHQNGSKSTYSFATGLSGSFNNQVLLGAGRNSNPWYGYSGNLQEVILIKNPGNGHINAADLHKIHSYLAIKYGITLNNSDNYINSNGTVVWSRMANSGYNQDIFGLGRDDNSGLYVKQATSSDNSQLIAYVGTLVDLNSNNTGSLNNDTYILFGSNGQSGVANYPVLENTVFANTTVTNKIDYRFKTTFKAQLYGTANATINFKIGSNDLYLPEADILFVSSNPDFDPASTRAYLLSNGEATNVLIENNDYLMFAKQAAPQVVNYTKSLWLKAEDLLSLAHGANVTNWPGVANLPFTQATTARYPTMYKSGNDLMNFHPAVNFPQNGCLVTTAATLDPNKSYYLFYVSQFEGTNLANQHVVYAMHGAGNYNGWYQKNPSFTTNSTVVGGQQQFVQTGTTKNYGITGVIRPNTITDLQTIYLNGNWQKKPAGTLSVTNTISVLGGTTNATPPANTFIGKIQEIIMYESSEKGTIDQAEAQKINSYLALKYGLTLEIGDYVDDTGDVIWSRSTANISPTKKYQYSIFGIGRNDAMGIYQKQARAFNKPYDSPFAIYVGSLMTLNQDNTAVLPDNSFLMLGGDELVREYRALSTNLLSGTTYRNSEILPDDMNYTSAVYQVQTKNWPGGTTVDFKNVFNNSACFLLVSTDDTFNPANTDMYPFDIYTQIVTGITLSDGDYISVVTSGDPAPGGVFSELRMWMNPEPGSVTRVPGTIPGTEKVTQWQDFSSNNNVFSQATTNRQPIYSLDDPRMNFHPSVVFSDKDNSTTNGQHLLTQPSGIMSVQSPERYTFFTVLNNDFQYNGTELRSYPMGFGGTTIDAASRYPAFGIYGVAASQTGAGRMVDAGGAGVGTELDGARNKLFKPRSTIIMYHEVHRNTKVRYEFDGHGEDKLNTTTSNNSRMGKTGSPIGATLGGASLDTRYLHGPLAEIFAYERELEQGEKDAIYSYLALKYGITLFTESEDSDTAEKLNFDYTLSDNTSIWPGMSSPRHQKYHNNVAALVRDDVARLDNKQSHSTADGGVVYMAIGPYNNWTGFDRDKSALAWGNDTTSLDSEVFIRDLENICGELDSRLRRIWLVDNSAWQPNPGNPSDRIQASQKVTIRLNPEYFPYPASPQYQINMLIADSEDDLFGGTAAGIVSPYDDAVHNWREVIPSTVVDGKFQFEYTFTEKYTYFTFGIEELGGGCTTCSFDGNKKAEFINKATWNNGNTSNIIDLDDDFSAIVSVSLQNGATFRTTTPRAYTNNTLHILKGGARDGVIETVIKPVATSSTSTSVPAGAFFEIYGVGRESTTRFDNLEITGKCSGATVYPRLSYVAPIEKSSYRISGNSVVTGLRTPTTTYTANTGRLMVRFNFPVEEISIKYKTVGSDASGNGEIGIGPVHFYCPSFKPPVNEAGFRFVKEAPSTSDLCKRVDYYFDIYNAHCDPRFIDLYDMLPDKMVWYDLQIGDEGGEEHCKINSYVGQRELKIDSLLVPGGKTFIIKATAEFTSTATPDTYGNTAKINYTYIKDDVEIPGELISWDLYDGEGMPSQTIATGDVQNKLPPIEYSYTANRTSYAENTTVNYTLTIKHDAAFDINDVILAIHFPEEFIWVGISGDVDLTHPDSDNGDGFYHFSGITLEAGVTHTVTFSVKAPPLINLPVECDEETGLPILIDGKPVISNLETDFNISYEGGDPCIESAFEDSNDIITIPYRVGVNYIITNRNITTKITGN